MIQKYLEHIEHSANFGCLCWCSSSNDSSSSSGGGGSMTW